MKSKVLTLICLFFIGNLVAQDSNLYQTWFLYQLEADLEGVIWDIEVEQPEVFLPYLTINSDLTFDGMGACNGFSGFYTYNSSQNALVPNDVFFTLGGCDTSEETDFENLYFNYVEANTDHVITLTTNDDYMELKLENAPGYIATYRNFSLSLPNKVLEKVSIYPNPVSNQLNISYSGFEILEVNIFDVRGSIIYKAIDIDKPLDLSELTKGVYFLEILSKRGKEVQKFIKS